MGCWHSLWGACLQVPARSMLFLMFSPFPKGLDNTAVMRLPEKFFQLRVVFTFMHGQNSKHESSFLFRCDPGTGTATSHNSGGLIHMVFFLGSQRAPLQLCRVRMAPSVVVLPRGGAEAPALSDTSFPTSYISQWLTLQALTPESNESPYRFYKAVATMTSMEIVFYSPLSAPGPCHTSQKLPLWPGP